MGSLASRPRAPQVQPVAVQQAAPPSAPEPAGATTAAEPAPSDAQIASQVRSDDLLRRRRGRAGTVLTGFRGLSPAIDDSIIDASRAGRNSLLGE